jgi:hypothetical protein
MRILLFGEYSNVHHTLCEALRRAGHEVLLISDGDGWKDYPRDVDLRRTKEGPIGSLMYLSKLATLLPKLRGYDVVQIVNPIFLDVKARWNRWVFDYLKRNNGILSVGCFGDDYYVISRMQDDKYLAYTDFYAAGKAIDHEVNRRRIAAWTKGPKAALTQYVMQHADCLVPCLYEYWKVYDTSEFHSRLRYIPLPIDVRYVCPRGSRPWLPSSPSSPVRILFASQKLRGQMKGTDQLEPLFDRLAQEFPEAIDLCKIESVPFEQYQRLVAEADVVVDQLYSFTPAMGALESMAQGKVVISGYEPEYQQFIDGPSESGIINLRPFDDAHNYEVLRTTLTDRNKIARLQSSSQAFVRKYHNADDVARQFVEFWSLASSSKRPSQR